MLAPFLNRRVSSFLGLSIVVTLAFIAGAVIIYQSSKLKALQEEIVPWYIQQMTATTTNY
ncbi:hypothetical protein COT20_01515 [bacterium (Candidatus Gribaldobacteria) CG08_land_8_20_14_0_20_39_15]|uniref:Uncharacterized protein n=1 Tax=bacterium (Candidatus Gribaldobacteria) CG08_land_8_20_14_0_20_39_15 TaxID=2014273 RepID=A0A2M6XUH8_9BACT|nr:MAG: hypothetical protein COT20_01515 [bacterium (Candidatus Gribaldobacteria) CG08_land_8_20_14_0_20_39_15]